MLAGQGYTQILEMIMKRLQPTFFQGTNYIVRSGTGSGLPVVDPDTPGNPYDPRTIRAFEDFDYHLEYNEEDELISFTSHDGLIRYTLNKDSFDDLITISVHTIKIDFKIALIYENYDLRRHDPETDEKGKLTDVIILTTDGEPFPLGLSVQPQNLVVGVGDRVEFKAIIQNADGSTFDCTNVAEWATDDPNYTINQGVIENAPEGVCQVTAMYQMVMAYAQLEVKSFVVVVEPQSTVVEYVHIDEVIPFKAFAVYPNGRRVDITAECTWSVSGWTGSKSNNYYNVTVMGIGEVTVTAVLNGKQGEAVIESQPTQIQIIPPSRTVYVGNSATFGVMKVRTGEDLTNHCIWSIDKYTIGQDGIVVGTDYVGTATITVNYKGALATATLNVELAPPRAFPDSVSGSGKFYAKDYVCDVSKTVTIEYNMYSYPDKIDVYNVNANGSTGSRIAGTSGMVSNRGSISFNVTAGQKIRIVISSDDDGTAWNYYAY